MSEAMTVYEVEAATLLMHIAIGEARDLLAVINGNLERLEEAADDPQPHGEYVPSPTFATWAGWVEENGGRFATDEEIDEI